MVSNHVLPVNEANDVGAILGGLKPGRETALIRRRVRRMEWTSHLLFRAIMVGGFHPEGHATATTLLRDLMAKSSVNEPSILASPVYQRGVSGYFCLSIFVSSSPK